MPAYIGDQNNKARKVKNIYIGDENNKARKVIKGYIGDENNKARLFYYYLKEIIINKIPIQDLTNNKYYLAATNFKEYGIYAGGMKGILGDPTLYSDLDIYTHTLTKILGIELSLARTEPKASSIDDFYIFIGGGKLRTAVFSNVVDVFDSFLSRNILTMSSERANHGAASAGRNVLFVGGRKTPNSSTNGVTNTAECFTHELAQLTLISLPFYMDSMSSAKISSSGHALFGGITSGSTVTATNYVVAISNDLVVNSTLTLSSSRRHISSSDFGENHCIFGEGMTTNSNVADIFDKNLVRHTVYFNKVRDYLESAAYANGVVLFAGWSDYTVEGFDEKTFMNIQAENTQAKRQFGAGVSVANKYILFGGGYGEAGSNSSNPLSSVDGYEIL